MTEKELKRYSSSVLEIELRRMELRAYEETVYSASTKNISPLPVDHEGDPSERLIADIERIAHLKQLLNDAIRNNTVERCKLEGAYRRMQTDAQRELFRKLYFDGKEIGEAADALHYCLAHAYRLRREILSLVADLPA